MWDLSSPTRGQTHASYTGNTQILNPWTAREVSGVDHLHHHIGGQATGSPGTYFINFPETLSWPGQFGQVAKLPLLANVDLSSQFLFPPGVWHTPHEGNLKEDKYFPNIIMFWVMHRILWSLGRPFILTLPAPTSILFFHAARQESRSC